MNLLDLDYEIIKFDDHYFFKENVLPDILNYAVKTWNSSAKISNIGGWQSKHAEVYETNSDNHVSKLFEVVMERFGDYTSTLTPINDVLINFKMVYWYNVNYYNDYNAPHAHIAQTNDTEEHEKNILSGCYYLKKPENSGNIVFCSQKQYLKGIFEDPLDTIIEVNEGEIILFPSDKMHYVEPNKSNGSRVSLAFNIQLY